MDYAVVESKNSELSWDRVQTLRGQKKGIIERKRAPKLVKVIRGIADAVAKAALFLGFVYGAFYGYRFLTTSPHFAINEISVKGNHVVGKEQLFARTGPIMGSNIFTLNLSQLSRKLNEHPWIRSVSIERSLPQSLGITLVERIPYARIQMDRMYVLDNFGVLLSEADPEHSYLPLIVGVPAKPVKPGENIVTESLIHGLHTMHYFNGIKTFREDPVDTLRMIGSHRIMLVTRNKGTQIFMDMNMLSEGFRNFKVYMEAIEDGIRDVRYIDLSFKGKVIIKHALAENKPPGQKSVNTGRG